MKINDCGKNMLVNRKIESILKYSILVFLCFYIFYIPSMSYTYKLNLIAYVVLPLLATFIIIYTFLFRKININDLRVPILFLILFILLAFISTIFGAKQFSSLPRLYLVLLSSFVLFGCFHIFNNPKNVVLVVSLSMFAFVLFYFGFSLVFNRERLLGWLILKEDNPLTLMFFRKLGLNGGGGPNIVSSYFGTASILFLYLALFEKRKIYKLCFVPYILSFLAGVTTASRQFLIGTVVVSIFLYFLAIKNKKILILVSLTIIVIFFVLFMVLKVFEPIRNPILDGLGLLKDSRGDKSASSRILMQIEAFEIGGSKLFFGFGADGFETVSGWGGYAHNTYANLYVSFGVIGLILYFIPIVKMLIEIKICKSTYFKLLIFLIIYYLIIGLFIVWYKDKIFFIVYGLIIYVYSIRDKKIALQMKINYFESNI